jgi:copper chaperone CopZ
MQKLAIKIEGMQGVQDERTLISGLKNLNGVLLVNVDSEKKLGVITFNERLVTADEVVECVTGMGFGVSPYDELKESLNRDSKVGVALLAALGVLLLLYTIVRVIF